MVEIKKLPDDPALLKNIIENLKNSFTIRTKEIEQKVEEKYSEKINLLYEEIRFYKQKLFGTSSEKQLPNDDPNQPNLFDEVEETVTTTDIDITEQETDSEVIVTIKGHTRKKQGGRKPISDKYPRKKKIVDLSDDEKICACGCKMKKIGKEISETLHKIPAQYWVEQEVRFKYACRKCEGVNSEGIHPTVKIAPPTPAILPKSYTSPSILAHIVISKFEDALPLYRQEKIFARQGLHFPRSTMSRWMIQLYEKISPLLELMNSDLRAGPVIGIDETRVQVMKEPGKADTTQSYMWVCRGGSPGKIILQFHYSPNRGSKTAQMLLQNYNGYVVSDGYAGYNFLNETEPDQQLKHAGCWAHLRRKFDEAAKASKKAVWPKFMIQLIKKLYLIEKKGRTQELLSEELHTLRTEKSTLIVKEIFEQIEKKSLQVNPSGLTGKAIAYALKFKKQFKVFLTDGAVPIDNNPVENAIRPFVVGRKNWLFSGSPRGAEASAGLYSLIETTRAASLNSYWYLCWLFEKLPITAKEEYTDLLPYNIGPEVLYETFHGLIDASVLKG